MKLVPKNKFTWVLIIFMIYIYYKDYVDNKPAPKNAKIAEKNNQDQDVVKDDVKPDNKEVDETIKDKVINKIKQNDTAKVVVDALVRKAVEDKYGKKEAREIIAGETGALAVIDVIKGSGAELRCGAQAVINYDAFMSSGVSFDSTTTSKSGNSPITIQVGKNQVIKGLEAGIVGMREGGKRKISIPPELGFNVPGFENSVISKGDVVSYDVELISVKEGAYKNNTALNVKNEIIGNGKKILCGDKVKLKYSLKNADGTLIPDAEGEAEFVAGSGRVPMGLELAVLDMKIGGKKTVLIPYDLSGTVDKTVLKGEIKFNKDEPIKADIEVMAPAVN